MVQEFHLSVTPIRGDDFYVRVEWVEQGVPLAEEQVTWPVDEWLAQARQVFTDPLSEFFQSSPYDPYEMIPVDPLSAATVLPTEPALIALGQDLYNHLFQGTVRDSWVTAQGVAQNRQERLRLRLGLKGDRLPRLPWEVLHAGNRPIAATTDIIFSRYQGTLGTLPTASTVRDRLKADQHLPTSLHILMVLAAPTDQANLELRREALQLKEELQSHRSSDSQGALPDIQLTLLEHPGREELTQTLEQNSYQVFHFAGHSSPGPSGGRLHLVNSSTGLSETLNGDDLAGLLANNEIQLAVLNSCLGTQAATSDEFDLQGERTLAEALIRRGIPGVLAMAERIPDQVALTLSRLFYRNLKFGQPLDLSLCRARQGLISAYGSNQLYWALPILYLHSEFKGRLVRPDQQWSEGSELFVEGHESMPVGEGAYRGGSTVVEPSLLNPVPPLFNPDDAAFKAELQRLEAENAAEQSSSPSQAAANTSEATALTPQRRDLALRSGQTAALSSPLASSGDLAPPAIAPTPETLVHPQNLNPQREKRVAWLIAGATGLLLLGAGLWGVSQPPTGTPGREGPAVVAGNATVDDLSNQAITAFDSGNFVGAITKIDQLLDRGALEQAQEVFALMSQTKLNQTSKEDNNAINFLRGRLSWQQYSQMLSSQNAFDAKGVSAEEHLTNAKLQWSTVAEQEPNNTQYANALGFALYAEGNVLEAQQRFKATYNRVANLKDQDQSLLLQTEAGLALASRKLAETQTAQSAELWKDATTFYERVMRQNATAYHPNALGKDFDRHWIWTRNLIQDWAAIAAAAR